MNRKTEKCAKPHGRLLPRVLLVCLMLACQPDPGDVAQSFNRAMHEAAASAPVVLARQDVAAIETQIISLRSIAEGYRRGASQSGFGLLGNAEEAGNLAALEAVQEDLMHLESLHRCAIAQAESSQIYMALQELSEAEIKALRKQDAEGWEAYQEATRLTTACKKAALARE